jgi:hypothetical protein
MFKTTQDIMRDYVGQLNAFDRALISYSVHTNFANHLAIQRVINHLIYDITTLRQTKAEWSTYIRDNLFPIDSVQGDDRDYSFSEDIFLSTESDLTSCIMLDRLIRPWLRDWKSESGDVDKRIHDMSDPSGLLSRFSNISAISKIIQLMLLHVKPKYLRSFSMKKLEGPIQLWLSKSCIKDMYFDYDFITEVVSLIFTKEQSEMILMNTRSIFDIKREKLLSLNDSRRRTIYTAIHQCTDDIFLDTNGLIELYSKSFCKSVEMYPLSINSDSADYARIYRAFREHLFNAPDTPTPYTHDTFPINEDILQLLKQHISLAVRFNPKLLRDTSYRSFCIRSVMLIKLNTLLPYAINDSNIDSNRMYEYVKQFIIVYCEYIYKLDTKFSENLKNTLMNFVADDIAYAVSNK